MTTTKRSFDEGPIAKGLAIALVFAIAIAVMVWVLVNCPST